MYEQIARNRRLSLLLIAVVAALMVVMGYVIGVATGISWFGLVIAGALALVMSLTGYYKGDRIVLAASRARRVTHDEEPQLYNVVEEMSIASGNPMPAVYVIDDTATNAFATGRNPEHASIAVTSGLIQKLNREELQGVVAHEMSHVRNYDILYATLVGIMVGTIVLMADFFLRWGFWGGGGRRSKGGGQAAIVFLVIGIVMAIVAPIAARMVQLAISRRRESLADASAVELTRNPNGLADALEKISRDQEVLEVANRATAHLYIANPVKNFEKRASRMFSTHPPIEMRIQVLRAMASGAPMPS
ncbi:MAG: zinc metalloprotease HtpX [Gaiellales bacterium]|nr:MAG: zinc metalloprotease HtpX [Gaiellales bacterium]